MTGLSGALSSSDRVVETIVKGIRDGRLVPGQRLVESDLTTRLGVSRGPVRDALKRLAAEDLVKLSRHKGAYISALSRRDATDLLLVLVVLTGLMARPHNARCSGICGRHVSGSTDRRTKPLLRPSQTNGPDLPSLDQGGVGHAA